ncbi:MAG: tetratricopeptide repeat protein, partial [Chloroflexota bacterium]|nr:tetratricopeptide repeat protein [Chloroflexota bacterium]
MAEPGMQTLLLLGQGRTRSAAPPPADAQGPFALPGGGRAWVVPSAAAVGQAALAGVTSGAPLAIHSGLGSMDARGVYGPAVDRLAALLAVAQPGQILLSWTGAEALRAALPAGTTLRDLGERRLRDLLAREKLYQLDSPGRPTAFPPLPTLDALPNNLPPQLYPLIGRTLEVPALTARLRDPAVRMLTLTGTPGIGKTRLALQVAAAALPQFAGGAWFVPLAPLQDATRVPAAIAQAMGLRETGSGLLVASLIAALGAQPTLLVLDTLEQVPEIAALLRDLLAEAPQLKVLATSRAALHLAGEDRFNVPPLGLPDLQPDLSLAELGRVEAVAVFVARASEVNPRFALTAANAPDVAAICLLLDGLPLAIELAAARVAQWPPGPLLARLRGSAGHAALPVLSGGLPHLPARQQTLRGAIGWSYALLAPAEADLFAGVAVFSGGFGLDAAAAVLAPAAEIAGLRAGLDSLAEKSLLRQEPGDDAAPRYAMLETIREYAAEQLAERPAGAALQARHAAFYLAQAEAAAATAATPAHAAWVARLEADHANLIVALTWGRQVGGAAALGLRLALALASFWILRGYLSEGEQWLTGYLAAPQLPPELRLRARGELSRIMGVQGDLNQTRAFSWETLALARQLGDRAATALALNQLGNLAYVQGDFVASGAFYRESLSLRRQVGDRAAIAGSLNNLGLVALAQYAPALARTYLQESLVVARELGDAHSLVFALNNLASVDLHTGDFARAEDLLRESLLVSQQLGYRPGMAGALTDLSDVARLRGDWDAAVRLGHEGLTLWRALAIHSGISGALLTLARTTLAQAQAAVAGPLFQESLQLYGSQNRKPDMADCLRGLAVVVGGLGDTDRAARLAGAASALFAALDMSAPDARQLPDVQALAALQARSA